MKLCKNCKWFRSQDEDCLHETSKKTDPVYGKLTHYSAHTLRRSIIREDCGAEGQYWEAKDA